LVVSAVDMPGYVHEEDAALPFQAVDVALGDAALASFRESIENAMSYEEHWLRSGLPLLRDFVKNGSERDGEEVPRAPVRELVASLLASTSHRLKSTPSSSTPANGHQQLTPQTITHLRTDLSKWAERAHTSLQIELDAAFSPKSPRWNALKWYKLPWRVDDVSLITSDIIASRFLTEAQEENIYLAGKIEQAGIFGQTQAKFAGDLAQGGSGVVVPAGAERWAYKSDPESVADSTATLAAPPKTEYRDVLPSAEESRKAPLGLENAVATPAVQHQPWPLSIPLARAHIIHSSIPSLQARAQALLAQFYSITFSSMGLSWLAYVSDMSTTLYEAGVVAAVGSVVGLSRLQKWEGVRRFWEGEVREEGRKAVREVERDVGRVLGGAAGRRTEVVSSEVLVARAALRRAEEALKRVEELGRRDEARV
jgi:hypothetical protein